MRVYSFEILTYPKGQFHDISDSDVFFPWNDAFEPAGWAEYSRRTWPEYLNATGTYKPFFWPSEKKIFRSRSAAQSRVDIVRRWGGEAVLLEGAVDWVPVAEANERRKRRRDAVRIARLQAKIDSIRGTSDGIPF